jgi:hypothetical protein
MKMATAFRPNYAALLYGITLSGDELRSVAPTRKRGPKLPTPHGQSKRRGAKRKTLEQEYAGLIKAGMVKIVRERGKPPRVVWL